MLHRIALVPRRDTLFAWTILLPIVLLIGLVVYVPALNSLVFSFEFYKLRLPDEGGFVGLSNYIDIVTSAEFLEVLGRSLFIIVLVLPFELCVGLAGALLLNERFPGRAIVRAVVLLPWVLPPVVNGFLWGWLLNGDYGALNGLMYQFKLIQSYQYWLQDPNAQLAWVAVVQTWTRYALPLIILLAGLQLISDDLYQAAQVDGANAWQRLLHITLPNLRPSIALALTLEFVSTFQIFDVVWTLTSGGTAGSSINPFTKTLMVFNYEIVFRRLDLGSGSALSYLMLIISAAAGLILVRRLYRTGVAS
jgi:multiple sugar transport system permease protein